MFNSVSQHKVSGMEDGISVSVLNAFLRSAVVFNSVRQEKDLETEVRWGVDLDIKQCRIHQFNQRMKERVSSSISGLLG